MSFPRTLLAIQSRRLRRRPRLMVGMVGSRCRVASPVPRAAQARRRAAWPWHLSSQEDNTAQSDLPLGRTVAAPAFAELGRSQIPSVSEANQRKPGLEHRVSAAEVADPVVLSFPRERSARPDGWASGGPGPGPGPGR